VRRIEQHHRGTGDPDGYPDSQRDRHRGSDERTRYGQRGKPITVSPGAQVTIKNDDSAEHSVTSDTAGKFNVEVEGKEQGTLTAPTEPGEYAFHCTYHPSMHGTLTVK
jgi:plastocyanin